MGGPSLWFQKALTFFNFLVWQAAPFTCYGSLILIPHQPPMAIHWIPCLSLVGSSELEVYIFFVLSITPAPYLSTYSSTSRTRPPSLDTTKKKRVDACS